MRAAIFPSLVLLAMSSAVFGAPASAADYAAAPRVIDVYPSVAPYHIATPPHRVVLSYVKEYPFGPLKEDYTPYGQPNVSYRAYYGPDPLTARLRHRYNRD